MWLLLVAAGTGYLARCWQKARKCKSNPGRLKHDARAHLSQRSPPCTPKRGRSATSNRCSRRKRSLSAKGVNRRLFYDRKEGELRKSRACELDDDKLSKDFTGQFITSVENQNEHDEVQSHYWFSNSPGSRSKGPCLSGDTECMQDWWRELPFSSMKSLLLTREVDTKDYTGRDPPSLSMCMLLDKKSDHGSLHGNPATTLDDFSEKLLEKKTSSSDNWLASSKLTEGASSFNDINSHMVHDVPSRLQIPKVKTKKNRSRESHSLDFKEATEQALESLVKTVRDLGHKTCSKFKSETVGLTGGNPIVKAGSSQTIKGTSICSRLFHQKYSKDTTPLEKCFSLQREKNLPGSRVLHSHLLKALLDPECLDEHHRYDHIFTLVEGTDLERSMIQAIDDLTGLDTATDCRAGQRQEESKGKTCCLKCSKGRGEMITELPAPLVNLTCERPHGRRKCSSGSRESSMIAFGVALGVMFVATNMKNEFEDLSKLLHETKSMVCELKKQADSRTELDLQRLSKVILHDESMPFNVKMPVETFPSGMHPHIETDSCRSATENSPLELFIAANNHVPSIITEDHVHGFADLEAELEAELQLMELNVYNTNPVEYQRKQTQSEELNLKTIYNWQNEVDHDLHMDNEDFDIDIYDTVPGQIQDDLCESNYAVSPLELERRLWQVLEQRQEERICELENDLHMTNEKVSAKEAEVQWWKNHVWWLMEISLGGKSGSP